MTVLLDTSVLVAALTETHADHARCLRALEDVRGGRTIGFISAHTAVELYSVLTKLPRTSPTAVRDCLTLIRREIIAHVRLIPLGEQDYLDLLDEAAGQNIRGGTVYDAIVLRAAMVAGVDRVLTLNLKHFERIWTGPTGVLLEP